MASKEIFKIWYRAVTKDGKLWCESSSFEEVKEMSKGKKVTYHKLTQVLVTGNWEEMSKKDVEEARYPIPDRRSLDLTDPAQARVFDTRVQRMNHIRISDGFRWHEMTDKQIRERLKELEGSH